MFKKTENIININHTKNDAAKQKLWSLDQIKGAKLHALAISARNIRRLRSIRDNTPGSPKSGLSAGFFIFRYIWIICNSPRLIA